MTTICEMERQQEEYFKRDWGLCEQVTQEHIPIKSNNPITI